MLPETFNIRQTPLRLIHHAAHCDHHPPGGLAALSACLDAGAKMIEMDVIPLADGSFALLHDRELGVDTDGEGEAPRATRSDVARLHYRHGTRISDETVGFLEEAVALLAEASATECLQIDLKPFAPLTRAVLRNFLDILAPVKDRVQVSSVSDWAIRALAAFAPDLSLGFDPLLYLDLVGSDPRPKGIPPFRVGAYGLADDHPLSAYQWGPLGDYLAARAAALVVQVPEGCQWFIRAALLKTAYDAGFDWINFLHQRKSLVDAWTIDPEDPDQVATAQMLVERGVDALTTDAPSHLAGKLTTQSIF
jgi:glycerophosphoryl diester phosphodiesterase